MMGITGKIILTAALYLLAIGLGIWLSHSGRPLNAALSAVHKLVALAAAMFSAVTFSAVLKGVGYNLVLLTLLGACIVVLIATGAVLSGNKKRNKMLLLVHNCATALAILCMAGALYSRAVPFLLK